ncbi:MAG: hypothetical protein PHW66_03725 [Gallionella sp.]|nr:hypothetical protein [Gallionella sp.]
MAKDPDQDWLDALAGKAGEEADPEEVWHASLLRDAIKRHNSALGADAFDVDAGLQRLKFRMRREGLDNKHKPPQGYSRFVKYAMAASLVLTVGLTMRLYLHEQPMQNEADIMRGSQLQIVMAESPETRLKQLTIELDKLGIPYQVEREGGKIILKAQGVDPVKDEVASFLDRNHITPPVGMDIELDIRPLAKP